MVWTVKRTVERRGEEEEEVDEMSTSEIQMDAGESRESRVESEQSLFKLSLRPLLPGLLAEIFSRFGNRSPSIWNSSIPRSPAPPPLFSISSSAFQFYCPPTPPAIAPSLGRWMYASSVLHPGPVSSYCELSHTGRPPRGLGPRALLNSLNDTNGRGRPGAV